MKAMHPTSSNTLTLLATAVLAFTLNASGASLTGTYDEQVFQTNEVDQLASFVSSTGGATSANMISGTTAGSAYTTFKADVASAFSGSTGGVIDFDTDLGGEIVNDIFSPITSPITAAYDASKTFNMAYSFTTGAAFRTNNQTNRTPISDSSDINEGGIFQTTVENPGTLTLDLSLTNAPDDLISQFGFTFLSRTSRDYGTVTAVASFSDGSTLTSSFLNTSFAAGAQDTFFGFIAPTGESITQVTLTSSQGPGFIAGFSLDDAAFVTSAIPEPTSSAMLLGASMLMLGLRKRRR